MKITIEKSDLITRTEQLLSWVNNVHPLIYRINKK